MDLSNLERIWETPAYIVMAKEGINKGKFATNEVLTRWSDDQENAMLFIFHNDSVTNNHLIIPVVVNCEVDREFLVEHKYMNEPRI